MLVFIWLAFRFLIVNGLPPTGGYDGGPRQLWQNTPQSNLHDRSYPNNYKPYKPSFEQNDDEYFGLNKHHKQQEPTPQYKQNNQYQPNYLNNQYGKDNTYQNNQYGQNNNYQNTQYKTNVYGAAKPSFENNDYMHVYKDKPVIDFKSNLLNTYKDLGNNNYKANNVPNFPSFEKEMKNIPYDNFGTKSYKPEPVPPYQDKTNPVSYGFGDSNNKLSLSANSYAPSFEKDDYVKPVNYNKDETKDEVVNSSNQVNYNNYVPEFEKIHKETSYYKYNHNKDYKEESNYAPNTNTYIPSFEKEDSNYLYKQNDVPYIMRYIKKTDQDNVESYAEKPEVYTEEPVVYTEEPVVYTEKPVVYTEKPEVYTDHHDQPLHGYGEKKMMPPSAYKQKIEEIKNEHMPLPYNPYRENKGEDHYNPYKENTGGNAPPAEVNDDYVYDPASDPYADPIQRQGHMMNIPNPAYLSPFESYDLSVVGHYRPNLTVVATEPKTIGHLYTEDLRDYQSFVANCYEKKFATIKVSSLKNPNARSMRSYGSQDRVESPEYPLTQDLTDFSYENLRLTPHGRHLLLVTLLENLENRYWEHRCEGLVQIYLPDSLKSPEQPPTPETACNLREIIVNDTTWNREDVMNVYRGIFASKIGKDDHFSRYNEEHTEAVKSLVKLALSMPDFDAMVSLLTVMRAPCNKRLYIEAMVTLIQARDDVGFIIPSLVSLAPELFFPNLEEGRKARQFRGNRNQVIRFRSTHRTYPADEAEALMWHIREDPVYSTMHWTWHSILNGANIGRLMQRRGELFFYMHRQMLNRYNCDRLAVGLAAVDPYDPSDWQQRGGLISYSPNLLGRYSARPPLRSMSGRDANDLNNVRQNLFRAVDRGLVNGQRLGYVQGQDIGISALGDAVEPNGNTQHGNYHNRGHVVISGMSTSGTGVMGGTENAIRDPAFYRWHQNIDLVFARYKRSLGSYTDDDLSFPGVTITGMNTVSQGRQNRLRTFLRVDTLDVNQEYLMRNGGGNQIRIERIGHDPFVYNFQLEVTTNEPYGIGRVFLVPTQVANENAYNYAIEMDRFLIRLNTGTVNIQRTTSQSPLFSSGPPSLNNLQNRLMRGMSERDFNWANCGYPLDMAVPRGSNDQRGSEVGMEFQLFFMVSQLLPQDSQRVRDWASTETAWGWCGFRDGQRGLPDARPMMFPFDRQMSLADVVNGRTNAASIPIIIRHDE